MGRCGRLVLIPMSLQGWYRRALALLIALTVLGGPVGCATRPVAVGTQPTSPPPSPSVRAHLGTVGVATGRFTPSVFLVGAPSGRWSGAGRGALWGVALFGSEPRGEGALLAIILAPITAPIGAAVGAMRAVPSGALGELEAALDATRLDLGSQLHAVLRDRVVTLSRERTSRDLRSLPDHGPSALLERVDYRGLAAHGIATVLEVRLLGLGLIDQSQAGEWANLRPPLSCFLTARVRLVRTSSGTPLYESTIGYLGPSKPLDDWRADNAARFREEVHAAVGSVAGRIVDQVFLSVVPPKETLRVRVRPAALGDVEARLLGEDGLLQGIQRFDAEFERLTLRAHEDQRLRAFLPEIARAPWDSELTLEGTVDGAPFAIELKKDDKARVSGRFEGLVFANAGEAREFVESFASASTAKLVLDGYAEGRRIRVTRTPRGVVLTDRGAGIPARKIEETEPDDALKVRVLPATLEEARTKLVGEQGLVTRGQRFEAEFEGLALAVEDVDLLIDLLRATLRARPRSKLKLDGTIEGRPFKGKLAVNREGRGRLGLEGFVLVSEGEVDRFLARFEGTEGLSELTLTGSVAGQKLRRTWKPAPGR